MSCVQIDEEEDSAELCSDVVVLSVKAAARLGWSLDSPLTVGKVQELLVMHEKMKASEPNLTLQPITRARSKASKLTEQEVAIAKEVAALSKWDFKKFARSGGVAFLLQQARIRAQATPAELGWDAIIRNVHADGAVGAFEIPPRGVELLPVLTSRLMAMNQMCSTMSVNAKDSLYLVAIGPYQWMHGTPRFLLSFHLVAMAEGSLRAFYKCFRAAELKHRRSSLPFSDEWYSILAIYPLSGPDDQRDLQFVNELISTFEVCNGKPLPRIWSTDIVRFTSPHHADKTSRRDLMSGRRYTHFTKDLPRDTLSVSPVCFLSSSFGTEAPATSSIEINKEATAVLANESLEVEHPIRIHQDLIGRLLVARSSNPPMTSAGTQIGLLMYHPDHQTPTDSTDPNSYAWLQELCARLDRRGVAVQFLSTPHVTQLLRVEPGGLDQASVQKQLQVLVSRGWLLGGVAVCSQEDDADAPLMDVLANLFESKSFALHVQPMVRLPSVSVLCIRLHPLMPDPADVRPISISSYVVPSTWLLSAAHRSADDWKQCRTDREPWYSVAPLEEHPDFSQIEAEADEVPKATATPTKLPVQSQP